MSAAAGFVFLMWELGHNLVMIGMCSVDEGGTLPGVPQRDVQTGVGSRRAWEEAWPQCSLADLLLLF